MSTHLGTSAPTQLPAQELTALLRQWLPAQRFFGGKGRPVEEVQLLASTTLGLADPLVLHVVLGVRQDGGWDTYQLPLCAYRSLARSMPDASLVGEVDGHWVYDALHDPTVTRELLEHFASASVLEQVRFEHSPGAQLPLGTAGRVLGVEQSNTSVVYGEQALLKVFRRLQPGRNPDVEVHEALTAAGSTQIAPLLGTFSGTWSDPVTGAAVRGSLGMLQQFLSGAVDGWLLATASVRRLLASAQQGPAQQSQTGGSQGDPQRYGDTAAPSFVADSRRLGRTTAALHAAMAQSLRTGSYGPGELATLAGFLRARLTEAVRQAPVLLPYAAALRATYDALEQLPGDVPVQRVHGDYHLGQVLGTSEGWVVLDFEGEPGKPLAERVELYPAVRDVAGMLRSFGYAALDGCTDRSPDPADWALRRRWDEDNRTAFCEGYAAQSGADPREQDVLLRAYEIDKAVYEVVYESGNRPAWLPIPLTAVQRLAGTGADSPLLDARQE